MNYFDKLKDPRWQRKRLKILERDKWQCQMCGSETKNLHVHHYYYERGKNPWQYPSRFLITLCSNCHLIIEESTIKLIKQVANYGLSTFVFLANSHFVEEILYSKKDGKTIH